jgi:hypothetical protein
VDINIDDITLEQYKGFTSEERAIVNFMIMKSIDCGLKKKCSNCWTRLSTPFLWVVVLAIGSGLLIIAKDIYKHVGGN